MKKLLILISFFVFLTAPAFSLAKETTNTDTVTTETSDTETTPNSSVVDSKIPLKRTIPTLKKEEREVKMEVKEEIKNKMQQAREEFKTKMAEIRDEKKQEIISNLDTRIATLNKNRTSDMNERLDRLNSILNRISTKEAALKSEGKNTKILASDIAAAQSAIDLAKTAVATQAAKEYTINITTESALKNAASVTIRQFITDIKAVRAKVVAAQKAVAKAHNDLNQLLEVTPAPTTSVSTMPTP